MDNAARMRQRVLAVFVPLAAVLYVSTEALDPKGTDKVIGSVADAFKMLPIAAMHPTQLYVAGSLSSRRWSAELAPSAGRWSTSWSASTSRPLPPPT
jgi:hypothetical protein